MQGLWSEEESARLLALVAERGQRWQAIGAALGRMPEACRDRYRETRLGAARRSGKWAPEEEARLADIVPAALAAAQVGVAVRCTGSRRLALGNTGVCLIHRIVVATEEACLANARQGSWQGLCCIEGERD